MKYRITLECNLDDLQDIVTALPPTATLEMPGIGVVNGGPKTAPPVLMPVRNLSLRRTASKRKSRWVGPHGHDLVASEAKRLKKVNEASLTPAFLKHGFNPSSIQAAIVRAAQKGLVKRLLGTDFVVPA